MKRATSIILLCTALAGCADTGVIKVGLDRYTVSTQVPFGGPTSAKGQALEEANSYCDSKGQVMLLDSAQSHECALHGGCGEAEIYFFCLDHGDHRLKGH